MHKRYRICRRHFDSDCLNGGCRRLLNTAVPTLHLNPKQNAQLEESNNSIATARNIIYIPVADADRDEHFELVLTENKTMVPNDVMDPIDVQSEFFSTKVHISMHFIHFTFNSQFQS